jgi:SAM-dependent methyltransferase
LELLNPSKKGMAIDISGGVGNYSIFLSDFVKVIIHCELHISSIIEAYNGKRNNMIFVRSAYLKLPFISDIFDYVICTDTLERGWNHEVKLLKEIMRIMKIGGKAIVDFHNLRWFKKNKIICAYKPDSIKKLLYDVGIKNYTLYPFSYVPTTLVCKESVYPYLDNLFRFLFPPIRHVVVFTRV